MRIKLFIYVIIIQFNFKYHNLFYLCTFSHHRIVINLIGNLKKLQKKKNCITYCFKTHDLFLHCRVRPLEEGIPK